MRASAPTSRIVSAGLGIPRFRPIDVEERG